MKINPVFERAIYTLVIVLSLVALWLVLNAPSSF